MVGSPVRRKAIPGSLIDKLLNNLHAALRWEQRRYRLPKDNSPAELKISPLAAIHHKSKQFRSILDLLFNLRLKQGGIVLSVNLTTVKTAPKGAINQLGPSLTCIMHAFAEAEENDCIFVAK